MTNSDPDDLFREARHALGPAPVGAATRTENDREVERNAEIAAAVDDAALTGSFTFVAVPLALGLLIVGFIPFGLIGQLVPLLPDPLRTVAWIGLVAAWLVLPVILAVRVSRRTRAPIRAGIVRLRASRIGPLVDAIGRLIGLLRGLG